MVKIAVYLAGGGARGAYQVGALKAISEILQTKKLPFSIISGVSIGSINAAILAQHADNFLMGVDKLESLWANIHCEDVYNTSNYELSKSVLRNLGHLLLQQRNTGFLLDTTPLNNFISTNINFEKIRENIAADHIETIEILANCYETQKTVSFYQHHQPAFEDWSLPRHISQSTTINKEHLIASGALPLFFPPININGLDYGDGSVGLSSPLRGSLRFNATKILIIGTRQPPVETAPEAMGNDSIGFAQVLGNILNSIFLDNLDRDIEMVNRMNEIARLLSLWNKRKSPWRPVETLYLLPSANIPKMAQDHYHSMPRVLRMLLNALGAEKHSGNLLSFLLFEKQFTQQLIEAGYRDTMLNYDAITRFFS